jgi:uncharacterized protein DUF1629
MDYYRLRTDLGFPKRWYLGDINKVEDEWAFKQGKPVDEKKFQNLTVKITKKGASMDFTETSAFIAPIVSEKFAECLSGYKDEIQLIPVKVPATKEKYFIMVVKNTIDCVDESKSMFSKFKKDDSVRPDLAGEYREIGILKINTSVVDKAIFRLGKFDICIIVNGDIKRELEKAKVTGARFLLVS